MSPLVERFAFPKNLTRGKRLRVICTVTEGDLPIEVEWWKDGLKIGGSQSHESPNSQFPGLGIQVRRIDEFTSLLAISFLETTHAGNYSCVASNSVASFLRSATLTIRGKFIEDANQNSERISRWAWLKLYGCNAFFFLEVHLHTFWGETPSFIIYSWSINHILEHEFFCLDNSGQ